ncbi:MAG: DEAD/DEAH box helicase [Candidatus Omnitrophica bacterium]|nr:DEAD/DEAH box helicase [Candidatus Omnitrophota bacterium]
MAQPSLHPFPYDAFQQRAIEVIERDTSLFVAAPTGSGKTVLADYVIERALQRRQRVIYTAPIKALSNQKFRDFTARHGEQVGILTGDVTINRRAPLVIMTTEIYRNTLLEDIERLSSYAWIIFDEVHYLDDLERGTVWEESLLFTPPHINLLALSATVPNVRDIAEWIRRVHQRPVEVIEETRRSVPLTYVFQCHNQILESVQELKRTGYAGQAEAPRWRHRHDRRHLAPANRLDRLIRDLAERRRLPAILFTFGRRRAEELAWELSGFSLLAEQERAALKEMFHGLCAQFGLSHDRTASAVGQLIDRGIAYHHAGMLPTVKEVIERCFATRLIKIIVTTETFALGVNMPARSVILDTLKKRADHGFAVLSQRSFLQMAGRAGRRGMDEEGSVYLRINPQHVSYPEVVRLLQAAPEPVHSRFNTTYATLLNLYRRHRRSLLDIFPKTLYYFQTSGSKRQAGLEAMERKLDLLEALGYITRDGLTAKGEFGSWMYGYELLLTELHDRGAFNGLDALRLGLLMAAVVYEPRPRMLPPKSHRIIHELEALCRQPMATIHKQEARFRIAPRTKEPAFHLTRALEAWMSQAPFERLTKLCEVDEGEIVRYFRMAVQLLRQLSESPAADEALKAAAEKAFRRINRDVVDAEAQLRLG